MAAPSGSATPQRARLSSSRSPTAVGERALRDPEHSIFDLAIIGGGINGCGIARDAAGRGLSVFLCEMGDLAGGTSSRSTKLIHGGLRYLEQYDFRLVREALAEREVLWRIAPHIVRPLRFVLPHQAGLRPAWMLRIGLFLYDHLGGRQRLPGTRVLDLTTDGAGAPLKSGIFATGFEYSDCWVDDARLVVFAIPYEGEFTLIGTTDHDYVGDPANVSATAEDIGYLCEAASAAFARSVTPADVVWTYSGVRPLYDDGASEAKAASRDYVLEMDDKGGAAPVLSIIGGKITTYRRLAEAVLERLATHLPAREGLAAGWTGMTPLPG